MKKVILIAFYFNQVNEIASKRLRALAKYLPKFGWEPIVIVPDLGFIPDENNNLDCRIITTGYEDMFSHFRDKLMLSKRKSGDESSNFNENNFSKNDDVLMDSSSFSNSFVSKVVSVAGEIFAYPDGMKYWYKYAFEEASKIIVDEDIDGIISSSWPITSHTIAKDLKDKYNLPWIADLRDLWNLNPYVSHTKIREHFEKNLEINTFENADVLTTTTDLAAKTLSTLHPNNKIVPILSGYDENDFELLNSIVEDYKTENYKFENYKTDDYNINNVNMSKLKFIYAGSLYGGKRDPSILFDAIGELVEESKIDYSRISLEFYGDDDNLEEIANQYGLLDIVTIGGRIPHNEVLIKQANSDVLLLISWNNKKEKMFIPGKIYEYFALKKPVLSIGYKEGSLKDLIEKTNVGYHVSDLESTKKIIHELYLEFVELGYVKYNSEVNIEDYSMVAMAEKFANQLDSLS